MAISTNSTAHLADIYKQVGIGLSLYRSLSEREANRHLHHLATWFDVVTSAARRRLRRRQRRERSICGARSRPNLEGKPDGV